MLQSVKIVFDSYVSQERQNLYVQFMESRQAIESKNLEIEDLKKQIERMKRILVENQHVYKVPDVTMYGGPKQEVMAKFNSLRQETQEILIKLSDKEGECESLKSTIKLLQSKSPSIDEACKIAIDQTNIIITQARNQLSDQEIEIRDLNQKIIELEEQLKLKQPKGLDFSLEIERLNQTIKKKTDLIEAEKKKTKEQYDKTQQYIALYYELLNNQKETEPINDQVQIEPCKRCHLLDEETKLQAITIQNLNQKVDDLNEQLRQLSKQCSEAQSGSSEAENLKKEKRKLEIINEGLTSKVSKLEQDVLNLKQQLDAANKLNHDLKQKITDLEMELVESKTKSEVTIQNLQAQINQLEKQIEALKQTVKDLEENEQKLKMQIKHYQENQLKYFMNQNQGPTNAISHESYLRLSEELGRQKQINADLEAIIMKRLNEQQKLDDIKGQLSALDSQFKGAKLGNEEGQQRVIKQLEKELNDMNEKQKSLEQEVESLRQQKRLGENINQPTTQGEQKETPPPKKTKLDRNADFGDGKITFRRQKLELRYIL